LNGVTLHYHLHRGWLNRGALQIQDRSRQNASVIGCATRPVLIVANGLGCATRPRFVTNQYRLYTGFYRHSVVIKLWLGTASLQRYRWFCYENATYVHRPPTPSSFVQNFEMLP